MFFHRDLWGSSTIRLSIIFIYSYKTIEITFLTFHFQEKSKIYQVNNNIFN